MKTNDYCHPLSGDDGQLAGTILIPTKFTISDH
jgi:hypothetical protein